MIANVICYWKMTSFMALDGVTSFFRLKDVTNTCKRMRRGLSIGGRFSVQRRKVESSLSSTLKAPYSDERMAKWHSFGYS